MSDEAKQMIGELQKQQQQLQQIDEHKHQIKAQQKYLDKAFDALEDVDEDDDVFRVVGPIGVKSDKEELMEELTDMKEKMETQLKSMESKEDSIQEKAQENQKKLQKMMSGGQ